MSEVFYWIGRRNRAWRILHGNATAFGPFVSERAAFWNAKKLGIEICHGVRIKPKRDKRKKYPSGFEQGKKNGIEWKKFAVSKFKKLFVSAAYGYNEPGKKVSHIRGTPFHVICRNNTKIKIERDLERAIDECANNIPLVISKMANGDGMMTMRLDDFVTLLTLTGQKLHEDLFEESNEPLDENECSA